MLDLSSIACSRIEITAGLIAVTEALAETTDGTACRACSANNLQGIVSGPSEAAYDCSIPVTTGIMFCSTPIGFKASNLMTAANKTFRTEPGISTVADKPYNKVSVKTVDIFDDIPFHLLQHMIVALTPSIPADGTWPSTMEDEMHCQATNPRRCFQIAPSGPEDKMPPNAEVADTEMMVEAPGMKPVEISIGIGSLDVTASAFPLHARPTRNFTALSAVEDD
mmetsp:Transcript_40981/g.85316  ORF Transcript_40981/g.85316 Transcript_40981/m.85316 type:complete len:223 (+) Transcript_40981:2247-2915(+)